jgi:hypothetical protein
VEDLEAIRAQLVARQEACWERLDDAVSELWAVHGADLGEIVARVRTTVGAESAGPAERSLREPQA